MNAAFCAFYANISCPSTPARCSRGKGGGGGEAFLEEMRRARSVIERCADGHGGCTPSAPPLHPSTPLCTPLHTLCTPSAHPFA